MYESINFQISSDEKWLAYILDQLLNNAYKYANKSTNVESYVLIKGKEFGNYFELLVEDNGIGIQRQDLERVFDKGFTGENGIRSTKSTGMGLYIAKKMINKLGHNIQVESIVGEFTRFKIKFFKCSDYLNLGE